VAQKVRILSQSKKGISLGLTTTTHNVQRCADQRYRKQHTFGGYLPSGKFLERLWLCGGRQGSDSKRDQQEPYHG